MCKIFSLSLISCLLVLVSCGPKREEQVKEFSVRFADFVNTNQKDSVQKYYPEFELTDSLTRVPVSNITVTPEKADGIYLVEYSPNISLEISLSKDGKIDVENSKGLIAFSSNQIELLEKAGVWRDDLSDIEISKLLAEENEKRNSFTSPDLDFFNLHGPVKSVSIKTTKILDPVSQYGYRDGTYTFDTKGNWLNYKKNYVKELKRNNAGQIIALIQEDDEYDYLEAYDYKWEDNEITDYKHYNTNHSDYGDEPLYSGTYGYSNGILTKEEGSFTGRQTVPYEITFTNFVFDDYGNWTSCDFHSTMPNPYGDQREILNSSGTIKRTIKYF